MRPFILNEAINTRKEERKRRGKPIVLEIDLPGGRVLEIDALDTDTREELDRKVMSAKSHQLYLEDSGDGKYRGSSGPVPQSKTQKATPKAQPKAQPKRGSSVLDVLFNPVAGAQFAGTVAKQIIPGAFESVAAVAEDVGRGAEFAGKASKAVQRKTGVAGVIPSKMAGVLGGGDPEWQEAYTAAAEEFDLPVMAAGMKQIASAIAGEARSISGSGQLTQGGKQFVEAVKADPLNALLQLGGVDKQTVIDGYAKGDEKALKRIRKALAMAILSGGTAAIGLAAKGASAPAAVARVGKAGAKAIDAGEAGAALVRGLKGGVPDEVAKPFVGYDLSGLPKPGPTSVLDEVLGEPAKKAQKAAQTAAEDAIDGALEYDGTDPNFQRRRIEIDIAEDEELLKMAANMLKNSGETDANGFWAEAIARIESRLAENRKKMDTNGSTDAFNPFTDDPTADPFVPFNPFADDPVTFNQQSVLDEVLAPKTSPAETVSTAPKQAPQMPPTVERVGYRGTRGNQSYGASEGDGVYIAHSPTLAKAFGEVQEIKYRAPSNPFIITKADLVAEDAGDGLRGGINDGDPEWVKIKKEAIREAYAELGDSPTLDKFHPLVSAKITAKLKERGHDALIVDGDDGWTVLFDDAGLVDDAIRANVAQRRPGSVLDEVLDAPAEPTLPTGATPEPTAQTVTPGAPVKESLQVQPTTPTSARQADINADREALGKAGFSTDDIRKWTELEAKANPNAIPKDDSGYKTGAWTDQETVNATAKLRELKSQIEALRKSGDDPETLVTLEDEFDNLTEAMYRSGTEQGRALASRRYTMDVDMSVDGLRARYKARAAKNGTKVDTKRIAELEQIAKDYKALKEQIDRKSPLDIDALTPNDPRLDPMHYDGLTDSSLYDPEFVNRAYVELFGDLPDDLPLDARAKAVREGLQDRINRAIEEDVRAANVDVLRDVRQWFRDARGGDGTSGWNVAVPGRNPGQWVAGPKVRMIDTQELPPEYLQMFIDWLPTRNKGAERYIRNGSTQDVNNRGLMGTVAEFDELIDRDGSRGVIPQAVVDEFVRDLTRMIGDDTGEVVVRRQRRVHLDSEFDDLLSQFKKAALSSANTGIPPELVPIVGKMVANRIKAGAASIEDIVIAIQKKFRERLLDPPERQDIIDAYAEYKATAKPEPNERAQKLREKRSKIEREMREESTQRKSKYVADAEAKAKRAAEAADARAKKAAERQQRIEADRKAKADQKAKARAEREAADAEAKALREEQERILGERKDWDKRNADKKRELERLNARIAELEKSIEAGTGEGPKTRKPSKEDADLARLRARQTMLQSKARAIYASTQPKGIADKAVGLLNVPRTIKASIDISAPGRQGWILGIGNPKAAGRAFADQMRALSTEEGAVMAQNAIMDRPNAPKYKAADLYLAPVDGSLNAKEEAFLGSEMFSRWKKFNPVRASDRAYAAYLNRLRADVFDNMVKGLGAKPTDEQLREIARYINIASGRGDIGGKGASEIGKTIGRAMPAAALGLWSPRNLISRIQFATGVPIAQAIKTPGARRLIAKEYAKSIIATGSVIGLAKLALERSGEGGVSGDISSSDFGKIRVGDTRVDIMAGVQQPLVLIGRLMTGKSTSPVSGKVTDLQNPKFGQAGPKELVSRFGWSKANPIFGSFEEFYTGKDFVGQPVGKGEALVNVIAPLSVKEIYEALTEEGIDKQDALVLLNIFGISTARFKDKEKAQP